MNNNNIANLIDLQDVHDQPSLESDLSLTPNYADHQPMPVDLPLTDEEKEFASQSQSTQLEPAEIRVVTIINNLRPAAKNLRELPYDVVYMKFTKLMMNCYRFIPKHPDTARCWIIPFNLQGICQNPNGPEYPYTQMLLKRYLVSHVTKIYYEDLTIWDKDESGDFKVCPGVERNRVDASHLCHHPYCINPSHIVFEPSAVNMARNACLWKFHCKGHGKNPSCIFHVKPIEKTDQPPSFVINAKAMKVVIKYRLEIAEAKEQLGTDKYLQKEK